MSKLAERIEKERFSSLNDPGIHGIAERINSLGFVSATPEKCSGHVVPELSDITNGKVDAARGESGYLSLTYNVDDKKSELFHNALRDIVGKSELTRVCFTPRGSFESDYFETSFEHYIECEGVLYERIGALEMLSDLIKQGVYKGYKGVKKAPSFSELVAKTTKGYDYINGNISLDITINGAYVNKNADEIANALCHFWQQVSDLIGRFENTPLTETLRPEYFGLKSNYGTIESTHPAYDRLVPVLSKGD